MTSPSSQTWGRALIGLVAVIVSVRLGSEFSGRGFPYWHVDLDTLHREQVAFYSGHYPHSAVEPTVEGERAMRSAYPPFSFLLLMSWLPPGMALSAARMWFPLCQLAALGMILAYAWRCGRPEGRGLALLLTGTVLAMTGLRADLLFGNVSTITVALLTGALWALERNRPWAAALAWVGATAKPQIGWLFALTLCRRRGWFALTGGVAILALLTGVACWWTDVSLTQVVRSSYGADLSDLSSLPQLVSLPALLGQIGVPATVALIGCALLGIGFGGWALGKPLADADALQQFALLGLVNRLCTYHNFCDDLLLVFPLFWLGRRAWSGGATEDRLAFVALGITVWLPTAFLSQTAVRMVVILTWALVVAWLVWTRDMRTGRTVPPLSPGTSVDGQGRMLSNEC